MELAARVAASADDMAKVFALRSAVYMAEQGCPYDEEFDGNDYCATHILGTVDGEPAAVMRLRYFADFVKVERVAVLSRFRNTRIFRVLFEAAIELCRRKGYRKLYGHAQKRLARFWTRLGFKPLNKNFPLVYSDHEYVEMYADLEPREDAITMMSDPYVILRPEGQWDMPSVLDRSSERPATNPHRLRANRRDEKPAPAVSRVAAGTPRAAHNSAVRFPRAV